MLDGLFNRIKPAVLRGYEPKSMEGYMEWNKYPIGTKAYAIMGGYWERTSRGWKWCTGATFPTPGGDVSRIELPVALSIIQQQVQADPASSQDSLT